ncbi:Alpha/Beta hydrolase protein [Aspergillus aurantiobrunneus]
MLNYDSELLEHAGPNLQAVVSGFQTPVHDTAALRAFLDGVIAPIAALPVAPDTEVTVYQVPSTNGHKVPVYHVARKRPDSTVPAPAPAGPALLYAHGGGFMHGSAKDWIGILAHRVQVVGVPSFAVDYRLAPEHPFPAALDDMYAALTWLHENAAQLGVDRARIAVHGESAGATLAAGVALLARDRALSPPLAKQVLAYPALDDRTMVPNPALAPFATWNYENNRTAFTAYLGGAKFGTDDDVVSPYAAPARATSLEGLPPMYIDVGALDIFRDECIAYAAKAAAANVNVELHVYAGVPHMFEMLAFSSGVAQKANADRTAAMKSF